MSKYILLSKEGHAFQKNEAVTSFRGENYILTDWREPGEMYGGANGKIYCLKEGFGTLEWYPSVIRGEFVLKSEVMDEIIVALDEKLGGVFDSNIMNHYCSDIKPENYSNSADYLLAIADRGFQIVKEGKVSLNELLNKA